MDTIIKIIYLLLSVSALIVQHYVHDEHKKTILEVMFWGLMILCILR